MKNRTEGATAESPEQLVAALRGLLTEAEQMVAASTGDVATDKMDSLHSRLEAAQEKLKSYYGTARQKVINGAKRTDETIRAHPYESLAVALGVGVLLGALLRRSH